MTWRIVKLGDVCSINNGGTPKSKVREYWDGGVQWLTPKDMGKLSSRYVSMTGRQISQEGLDNSSAKIIPEESVVLSCRAPIGHVAINQVPMSFNQGCKGLVPTDKILVEYLYYFLISSKQLLNDLGTGTTFKEISAKTLHQVDVPLPPIAVQQRIVAKIDAAFAEIDKEIRNVELKIRSVSDLFTNILDDALGKNKTTPLINVCHKITDGSHYSPKTLSDEYPYITVKDICDDKIDFNNCKFVDKSFYEDLVKNNCKPINGDVLFSKDGTVGKVSLVDYEKDFVVLSSLAILSPNKNFIIPKFLFYTLKSKSFIDEAVGKKTGAAIRRIILKTLKNIKISVPELNEQTALVEMLDKLSFEQSKLTQLLKLKLLNMNQLKNSLMKETLFDSKQNNAA